MTPPAMGTLQKEGHRVVGVFTVPDKDGKADPLGECVLGHWVKWSQGWLVTRAGFAALNMTSTVIGPYQDKAFISMAQGGCLRLSQVCVPASREGKEGAGEVG